MQSNRRDAGDTVEMLADLLAERIANRLLPALTAEVERLLAEKLEDLPGRHEASREVMRVEHAAEFLDMSPDAFKRLAPSVPRCRISDNRFVYLRDDLLEWLKAKQEAPTWWHRKQRDR